MLKLTSQQINLLKTNAVAYANKCNMAMVLDSNLCESAMGLKQVELLAGFNAESLIKTENNSFSALAHWLKLHQNKPILLQLNYDLKNELEKLHSSNHDEINFENLTAFVPQEWFLINKYGECEVGEDLVQKLLYYISDVELITEPLLLEQRVSMTEYKSLVEMIKNHIVNGDFYELNYCMEFFCKQAKINPEIVYLNLVKHSPVPFAAFYKNENKYLLCASPERFMMRVGDKIYSQPIKGTAPRDNNQSIDLMNQITLKNSEKETAENLMIVDLVRNDLAKHAEVGSVCVDELFGIYPFKQVYQMISTISASCATSSNITIIQDAFPMGSMTGAPKVAVMEHIEKYETTKRGLYAGSVGYILPNGNFDLNVVIRSIQYNAENGYLNFMVGSAITYDSVADDEYTECLLKAKALFKVLS